MDADEDAAILAWIRGTEKLPQPNFLSPGLTALIRRLRANGDRVSVALARALDPIGVTEHQLKLVRCERPRGRGRPRKRSARDAVDELGLGAETNARIATKETAGKRRERDLETGDFAKAKGVSKAKVYAARSKLATIPPPEPKLRSISSFPPSLFDDFLREMGLTRFAGAHGPRLRRDIPIEGMCLSDLIALELSTAQERQVREEFVKRFSPKECLKSPRPKPQRGPSGSRSLIPRARTTRGGQA
jgi:hypothetical protein